MFLGHASSSDHNSWATVTVWGNSFVLQFTMLGYIYTRTECPKRKGQYSERSSFGHSKKKVYMYCTCVLFRPISETELFHYTVPKLLIWKRYYILFLIPVFIVQVTKLVQFTSYNTFSKIPPSTSMHFATRARTWRVARLYSVQCSEVALSRKPFGIGHMYTYTFLLLMTDTVTSQNTDLSSWATLHAHECRGFARRPSWLDQRTIPQFIWRDWNKLRETIIICVLTDSNRALPKFEKRALPLRYPVRRGNTWNAVSAYYTQSCYKELWYYFPYKDVKQS
jgi:hypothetical protein